jgi:hypothetical protein
MSRLRRIVFVLGVALLTVACTSGQDKKTDNDDPRDRGGLPPHLKDLNLTAEQKDKIAKTHAEYQSKIDELEKKIADLRTAELNEHLKFLNDEQKKKLIRIVVSEDKPVDSRLSQGRFVGYIQEKGLLIIYCDDATERKFDVSGSFKLVVNGKEGKWDDVKADDRIILTIENEKVTKIEIKKR